MNPFASNTVISSESPPPLSPPPLPPRFDRNGHKNVELSRGDFFHIFFKLPPLTFGLTPGGFFFAKKNARPRGEHRKFGSVPSGSCQLFAIVVMLVVILGVIAQKFAVLVPLKLFLVNAV